MKFETIQRVMKPMVKTILKQATAYEWTLQGLGMLRLHLTEELRLHVWNQHFAIPNVSAIHDHPWSFQSMVIAGCVRQYRYIPNIRGHDYHYAMIETGEKAIVTPDMIKEVPLIRSYEEFKAGSVYGQNREDIHESMPDLGTVTLCLRILEASRRDHARVFWKEGEFVSAAPRKASDEEVLAITQTALEAYFND